MKNGIKKTFYNTVRTNGKWSMLNWWQDNNKIMKGLRETWWDYKAFDFRWLCWQFPVLHFNTHMHAHRSTHTDTVAHNAHIVWQQFLFISLWKESHLKWPLLILQFFFSICVHSCCREIKFVHLHACLYCLALSSLSWPDSSCFHSTPCFLIKKNFTEVEN